MENSGKPVSTTTTELIMDFERAWLVFTRCSQKRFEQIKLEYIAALALKRVTTGNKDSYWVEYLCNTIEATTLPVHYGRALTNLRRRFQEVAWAEMHPASAGYAQLWTS